MTPTILIILAVVIVIFFVIVASRPSGFRITRQTAISAPPAVVFEQVNDFHKWQAWSPWEKLDPQLKRTYSGSQSGVGTIYSWAGNKKVGQGRMTITDSRPSELIRIKLEFLKPFAATNTTEFTFKPDGNQTLVTWSMTGTNKGIAKMFCMFMNMDKMVGRDFEKGLTQMKAAAEAAAGG